MASHPLCLTAPMKRWRKIFVLPDRLQRWQKPYGATVEAELGVVGGNEGAGDHQVLYTDVKEAERFAREAGMDALAIAIGNAHGHYKGFPI